MNRSHLFLGVLVVCAASFAMGEALPQDTSSTPEAGKTQGVQETQEAEEAEATMTAPAPETPVKRSVFATDIVNREPVHVVDTLTTARRKVYYFTEITGMEGREIAHRWVYGDSVVAEVSFQIAGQRWRVYSSKDLLPAWTGTWRVQVVDKGGTILHEDSFLYRAKEEPSGSKDRPSGLKD
jgi:hypothetical protein